MRIDRSGALVVGGASGLGEATARALHARGAHVVVADLDAARGEALVAELGERARFAAADVTRPDELAAAVALAAEAPGGLRISIHCAGIGHAERLARPRGAHGAESFERVIAINLVGTFHALRLASLAMLANEPAGDSGERGVIVNTASIAAYDGQIGQVAYAASKGGVVALTLPAARDLAASGVRVCAIAPGLFDTPLLAGLPEEARTQLAASMPFPSRLGQPAEFAELACSIVENAMLNGEVIRLDGALRMAPR
jgi:NAD(P)-dependent dehydrogenase (short-subunit alcohol dehydrogenase family)